MAPEKRIRDSEIRSFLLRHALQKGIRIVEFISDDPGQKVAFYAHLEIPAKDGKKRETATAVSYEGKDTALAKAFLYLADRSLDFLEEEE